MGKITVLDKKTIDQIAAGEVIERPSSVVKELVENAIDAKADAVTVEVKDGGTTLIRITDNGEGIDADQVKVAFESHATSKIRTADDLLSIGSLGFRGEALSSIASVAKVELITRTAEDLIGTRYCIEGGEETLHEEIGAPEGTTFLVRDLFFNVPARRKFLKRPQTEGGYIGELLNRIALSHPEVSLKLILNGQVKMHSTGNGKLKDLIYTIYGRDMAMNVWPVSFEEDGIRVEGFCGKPEIGRSNRNFELFFVNGRSIRSVIFSKALEDAYNGLLMQHRYPFAVLHVTIPGDLLDVNVHPTKMEVRFANQEQMYHVIYHAIKNALEQRSFIPKVQPGKEEPVKKQEPVVPVRGRGFEPFEKQGMRSETAFVSPEPGPVFREETPASKVVESPVMEEKKEPVFYKKPDFSTPVKEKPSFCLEELTEKEENLASYIIAENCVPKVEEEPAAEPAPVLAAEVKKPERTSLEETVTPKGRQLDLFEDRFLEQKAEQKYRIIGQLFDTYWLIECENRFYMLDQHAAHEKCNYEKMMRQLKEKTTVPSQMISPPVICTLNMQEEELLNEHMAEFERCGFVVEHFGGHEYSLSQVPDFLSAVAGEDLFLELLDSVGKAGSQMVSENVLNRIATMACKASVKGGQKLSELEVQILMDELMKLENPYHCPHGRPTMICMTKAEIEKKFKRIV